MKTRVYATLTALVWLLACTERPGPAAVDTRSGPSFDLDNNSPQPNCERVEGTMELTFTGVWSGTADVVIGGEALHAKVSFATNSAKRTEGGVVVGTETATFDFGNGNTLAEQDHFSFGPTNVAGEWRYNALGGVVEGTGRFSGASGKLVMQGTAVFSATAVSADITLKGPICDGGA